MPRTKISDGHKMRTKLYFSLKYTYDKKEKTFVRGNLIQISYLSKLPNCEPINVVKAEFQ